MFPLAVKSTIESVSSRLYRFPPFSSSAQTLIHINPHFLRDSCTIVAVFEVKKDMPDQKRHNGEYCVSRIIGEAFHP